ncbi:MAG: ATP-binding domain-containing protein [Lachnospiraceae bacterium]|nr:ATP-binding domain-containing protein [Lachnospiraceae bacterium]
MANQEQEMRQEQLHFQECLDIIGQNVTRYQQEYEQRHAQVQELYKAINSGDVELYNQLMTTSSLEEHAASSLRKNRAAFDKPYFGRIDYTECASELEQQVYIGKNGVFRNKTDILIADWRAPISSVYYENELGPGEYGLPDERPISIDLCLKRTYSVEKGKLLGYYDSDVASNDELLVQYLSKNKDAVLGEIIATIQKEQNAIIRKSPFANLIVQGVAGSGKTTVAMHRISYLLYNYKQRFESNEYCIIGSNDLLLNYITSGLPELDVPNIKHMRMDQIFARLCEKNWVKKNKMVEPGSELCPEHDSEHRSSAPSRSSLLFMRELELYLLHLRESLVDLSPLQDKQIGTILSESNNAALYRENPTFSICTLLSTLDERVKTRIKFLMNGEDKDLLQAKLREYAGHYKAMRPTRSIYDLYTEFLQQWRDAHMDAPGPAVDWQAHLNRLGRREYDVYDIAALALIHYRVYQKAPNQEFGLLFLDEAQDFGIGVYYVLRTLLPAAYFTIMGDVSQNIHYDTGLNDWHELQKLFLKEERDQFLLLQKSYRNTIEISQYAGRILEKASSGRYKIQPVIRHGIPVKETRFWSDLEMAEHAAGLIADIQAKGYHTTAVICQNQEAAAGARQLLSPLTALTDGAASNFSTGTMVLPIRLVKGLEFDAVILWNLDMQHGPDDPRQAKLLYVAATRALHELHVLNC